MSQSKVSNFVVLTGLVLVLLLHPFEALAEGPMSRCAKLLRASSVRARLAMLSFGGASLGLMVPATHAVEQLVNDRAAQSLAKSSSANVLGARYAQDWVAAGEISPIRAQSLVKAYSASLNSSLDPLRTRIREYRKLTLWTPEQAKVADRALDHIALAQKLSPKGVTTTTGIRAELVQDPDFNKMIQNLPRNKVFTWSLMTEPRILVDGRSDATWLAMFFTSYNQATLTLNANQIAAMDALQKLYLANDPGFTLAMLTKMVSESLSGNLILEQKLAKASEMNLEGSFVHRSDIPSFSYPVTYHDIDSLNLLEDELDRWSLILEDPHFASIRERWQAGTISDFKALTEAEILIRGRSQVFKIYNSFNPSQSLTADGACHELYGDKENGANPLFGPIRERTPSQAVQIRVAQIRYTSIIETARETDAKKIESTMQLAHQAEEQLLADARNGIADLPAPQASCETLHSAEAGHASPVKFQLEAQH